MGSIYPKANPKSQTCRQDKTTPTRACSSTESQQEMIFHAAKSHPSGNFPRKTFPAASLVNTERETASKPCVWYPGPAPFFPIFPRKRLPITERPQMFLGNCIVTVGSYQHPAGPPRSSLSWAWTGGILGWSSRGERSQNFEGKRVHPSVQLCLCHCCDVPMVPCMRGTESSRSWGRTAGNTHITNTSQAQTQHVMKESLVTSSNY